MWALNCLCRPYQKPFWNPLLLSHTDTITHFAVAPLSPPWGNLSLFVWGISLVSRGSRSPGKPPPHTCQLLASCSAGRMRRQLGLVFLGFSPLSFPAGPARGQTLESSEVSLQHLSLLAAPEKIWPAIVGTACLLHFHRRRAFKMIVFFAIVKQLYSNKDV